MAWVGMRAMDVSGRVLELELKIRLDVVEWWLGHRAVAVMDRERLAAWLDAPEGTFQAHGVSLWWSRWGPAIEVERAQPSMLDPGDVETLRDRLRPP